VARKSFFFQAFTSKEITRKRACLPLDVGIYLDSLYPIPELFFLRFQIGERKEIIRLHE